jgi:hypothetical protein
MAKEVTLQDVEVRLKQIAFLLAQQVLGGALNEAKKHEKITLLSKAGLSNDDIGYLLGITAANVAVVLSTMRKATKKK